MALYIRLFCILEYTEIRGGDYDDSVMSPIKEYFLDEHQPIKKRFVKGLVT